MPSVVIRGSAVLGCAHRVDLTRRHNDRSPEQEE
jgi:hypothetical protein